MKVPVIVCGDPAVVEGVYVTEQLVPEEIVQVVPGDEKVPDPLAEKVTVSPTIEPNEPDTVAVQVVPWFTPSGLGEHVTEVVVVALLTVNENVPELPSLLLSPLKVPVIVWGDPDALEGV